MPTIGWTEGIPSNASTVGSYPAFIKSVWTAISQGMAVEHYWNGSGGGSDGSTGDLRAGGSRAFVAAQSASSIPSQGTGRLFLASDVSRLFAYDSSGTFLVGTPFFQEHATSSGTIGYWVRQSGSYTTTQTSGTTTVTYPIPYAQTPSIWQTVDNASWLLTTSGEGADNFVSRFSALAAGTVVVYWESLGLMSSASY